MGCGILLLTLNHRVCCVWNLSHFHRLRLWGTSTCSDGYVAKPCGCSRSCPDAIGTCSAYSLRKHGSNLAKHRKQGGKNHMSKLHFAIKRGKNTVQNVVLLLLLKEEFAIKWLHLRRKEVTMKKTSVDKPFADFGCQSSKWPKPLTTIRLNLPSASMLPEELHQDLQVLDFQSRQTPHRLGRKLGRHVLRRYV